MHVRSVFSVVFSSKAEHLWVGVKPGRLNTDQCTIVFDKLSEHDKLNGETTSCTYSDWHSYLL